MLLTHLPPAWETTIIQMVMAQGTILGITWDLTKQTILWYWDAEQAKRLGHHSPAAHKLSTVKKYQGPPSFCSQAAPPAGGSSQGKKKKCSSAGKGQKRKFGAVHFATATSPTVPVAHTVASLTPRGLTQRPEVSEPPSSFFEQGPWTSFNTTIISADHLQVPKTQRNIQILEQSLWRGLLLFPLCLQPLKNCVGLNHWHNALPPPWSIWILCHLLQHLLQRGVVLLYWKGISPHHPLRLGMRGTHSK